jgi:hypothetical protein
MCSGGQPALHLQPRWLQSAAAGARRRERGRPARRHGITLHLMLEADRQAIPDVPAVYFVRGGEDAVDRIVADAAAGLYDALHLNFTPCLTAPLLQRLAAGAPRPALRARAGGPRAARGPARLARPRRATGG